ncbi:MAG TPA: DUF3037 domain-containing protein [Longimicrobium sp.]|nr:DUF3037 domain-containing protein [Longimicrobium sp.]
MSANVKTAYNFAIIRIVPHTWLGTFVNVGVVVHARTAGFLRARLLSDPQALRALAPGIDADLLARYLDGVRAICDGDPAAGPLALLPTSERFHWLTSPRSDVIQCSPVHEGLCGEPAETLDELFGTFVRVPEGCVSGT